jgi:hypothetical protein
MPLGAVAALKCPGYDKDVLYIIHYILLIVKLYEVNPFMVYTSLVRAPADAVFGTNERPKAAGYNRGRAPRHRGIYFHIKIVIFI